VDTIKIADDRGRVLTTPDRQRVWHAQTPQGFRREVLLTGYRVNGRTEATDDAQLVERSGAKVVIVPGDGGNFKITTKAELLRAGIFLTDSSANVYSPPIRGTRIDREGFR